MEVCIVVGAVVGLAVSIYGDGGGATNSWMPTAQITQSQSSSVFSSCNSPKARFSSSRHINESWDYDDAH